LAGREAAIVTEIAGTTRDPVEQDLLIEDIPIRVIDTAGLRQTGNKIEQEGIRRTHNVMAGADIVVYVKACNEKTGDNDPWLRQYADKKIVLVTNKIDICGSEPSIQTFDEGIINVSLSAKTGAGMGLLIEQLKTLLGIQEMFEDVIMARKRHLQSLEKTGQFIHAASCIAREKMDTELLAEELRQAQEALGEITGRYAADDLLGSIFSSFCIGK
ncbi:MAG TPA: GTP-binding protein, partial [Gammaproteobacteria bacterium]|nr:GTP-binding protein [Gammaproteobacteria bacterium]